MSYQFQCVQCRFLFFNGQLNYTVEYTYGIKKWFIFKDEETSNAIAVIPGKPKEAIDRETADRHLYNFLNPTNNG